jgi:hypothetical protein
MIQYFENEQTKKYEIRQKKTQDVFAVRDTQQALAYLEDRYVNIDNPAYPAPNGGLL